MILVIIHLGTEWEGPRVRERKQIETTLKNIYKAIKKGGRRKRFAGQAMQI